jgi:hypothetical protein
MTIDQQKLDHHIADCILLGYNEESKAYKLMEKHEKMIVISHDVIFEEMSNQVPTIDDTKDLSFLSQFILTT